MGNHGHINAKIGSSSPLTYSGPRSSRPRPTARHSRNRPVAAALDAYHIDLGSRGSCRERAAMARSPDRLLARPGEDPQTARTQIGYIGDAA
jgi:hypothetical protein